MDAMSKLNNLNKARVEKNKETWRVKSKQRLEKIVKTKMTTLMIGSLDAIEKAFGDIWEDPKDDFEKQFAKDWTMLRQTILDLGNKQIRAMQKELLQYDIDWTRYQGIMEVKNED